MIRKPYIFVLFFSFLLAACSGGGGSSEPTTPPATLTSIQINIAGDPSEFISGVQYTASANGTFSDGQSRNVSNVTWTSSDTQVATVSGAGTILGVSPGSATITATSGTVTANLALTIAAPSTTAIEVVAPNTQIPLGQTLQLTVRASLNNGTTVDINDASFSSSATQTAEVSDTGLISTLATGAATITVTQGSFTDTVEITVTPAALSSINIQINQASIANGTTAQLTAMGMFTDNSTMPVSVTWNVADSQIASVNESGVLTGAAVGTTNVTATSMGITSNALAVTITNAVVEGLEAVQSFTEVPLGGQEMITATLQFSDNTTQTSTTVTWSSSDESVATISEDANNDILRAVGIGTATITATDGAFSSSFNVTVVAAVVTNIAFDKTSLSIPNGASDVVGVVATFSDNSTSDVTDSSSFTLSDQSVASLAPVNNSVLTVTGSSVGSTTLSAEFNSLSAQIDVSVTDAVATELSSSAQTLSLAKGVSGDISMTVEYSDGSNIDPSSGVAWTIADSAIATISSTGNNVASITGVAEGNTTATAQIDGFSIDFAITVTAEEPLSLAFTASDIYVGDAPVSLVATLTFTDNSQQDVSDQVVWSSSDTDVATISNSEGNEGELTAVAEGGVTITATFGTTSIEATQTITVLPSRFTSGFEMIDFNENPSLTIGSGTNQMQLDIATVDGQSVTLTGTGGVTIGLTNSTSIQSITDASTVTLTAQAVTVTQNSNQSIAVLKNSNDVYAVIQINHVEAFDTGDDGDLVFLSWSIRTDDDVDFSPYFVPEEVKFFVCRDARFGADGTCSASTLPASTSTSGSATATPLPDAFTIATFVLIPIGNDGLIANLTPEFDANVTAPYIDGLVDNQTIPENHGVTFRIKVPPTNGEIVNNFFRFEVNGLSFTLSSEFLSN